MLALQLSYAIIWLLCQYQHLLTRHEPTAAGLTYDSVIQLTHMYTYILSPCNGMTELVVFPLPILQCIHILHAHIYTRACTFYTISSPRLMPVSDRLIQASFSGRRHRREAKQSRIVLTWQFRLSNRSTVGVMMIIIVFLRLFFPSSLVVCVLRPWSLAARRKKWS